MSHRSNSSAAANAATPNTSVQRIAVALLCALFNIVGCSNLEHQDKPPSAKDSASTLTEKLNDDNIKLVVGPKYKTYNQYQTAVWIAHALAKLSCEDAYPLMSFENEYCATNSAMNIWRDIKKKDDEVSFGTLDDMQAVKKAGFLREYVWEYFHQDYWFKPDSLLLDKFDVWRHKHLAEHHANTDPDIVAVKIKSDIQPHYEASSFNSGYPDMIGNFYYVGDGLYFPSRLGKSVSYQLDKHSTQRGYADIRIYDIPRAQKNSERKSLTLAISSQVKAEILQLQKHGMYHDFSTVVEDTLTPLSRPSFWARGVYRFTYNHVKYFSTLYLVLTEDKVFRVRITYPDNLHYQNSDHFKSFAFEAFDKLMAQKDHTT